MSMLLNELVKTSAAVAATRARNEKIALLAALLHRLDSLESEIAVAYLTGELLQRRIGLGWASLRALESTPPAETPTLSLLAVHESFEGLASTTGRGSAVERGRALAELFHRATAAERDFLGRLIVGELRQGALAGLMAEALAAAAGVTANEVRRALFFAGDLREVARAALGEGRPGLERFSLRLFRPLQPMLAQPAETVAEALRRFGEAALDWKMDGARVQVHKDGADVRVFSRRLNDVTAAVPELVEAMRSIPVRNLVLDGETIALRANGAPHAFQVTMRRFGRKLDVDALSRELPLSPSSSTCCTWTARTCSTGRPPSASPRSPARCRRRWSYRVSSPPISQPPRHSWARRCAVVTRESWSRTLARSTKPDGEGGRGSR